MSPSINQSVNQSISQSIKRPFPWNKTSVNWSMNSSKKYLKECNIEGKSRRLLRSASPNRRRRNGPVQNRQRHRKALPLTNLLRQVMPHIAFGHSHQLPVNIDAHHYSRLKFLRERQRELPRITPHIQAVLALDPFPTNQGIAWIGGHFTVAVVAIIIPVAIPKRGGGRTGCQIRDG